MRIARVIVTWDCNRDCDFCVNKDPKILAQVGTCGIADLKDYDQVILTGGEPLLYPKQLIAIIEQLREQTPAEKQQVILYSALHTPWMCRVVDRLDGVHFALHTPLKPVDLKGFEYFQEMISLYEGSDKTFRLYIEPRITYPITIVPSRWDRVEVKPWLEECPLPEGEELFQLRPEGPDENELRRRRWSRAASGF